MAVPQSHQRCPDCDSSDALLINDDGSTKCFSCGKFTPSPDGGDFCYTENSQTKEFIKGISRAIPERGLDSNTCSRYRYICGQDSYGKDVQVATYRNLKGEPVFQKVRYPDKTFKTIGKFEPLLYGMHLFKGHTRKLIITEGEIDALSVYQVNGGNPVVSLPNGAGNAKKAIQHNLEFIEQFEEVILMFDMDDVGQKAVEDVVELISIGKVKIASLPEKDANDCLQKGKIAEITKAIFNAQEYRPDGVISAASLWEEINKPIENGLSYPWYELTKLTYGIREHEMIAFGAGTGMGKTEFFKEIEAHLLIKHNANVGVIHLEESKRDTSLGIMGKYASKKFHLPDTHYTQEEFKEAFDATCNNDNLFIYDCFGTTEFSKIKNAIRYMVKGKDCQYIFLDHITALADGVENSNEVNQKMRNIVSDLAKLTRELNFTLFVISHLRKSEGKTPHEEGGRVHLDDLLGASALKQWCSYVFGLERNQQAEDLSERHTTTLRCLKDRYTGQATGHCIKIHYHCQTGRLSEVEDTEITEAFGESDDY